ncbi:Glycosyltransferase involved in cell wall bisynthesis [Caloramator fervidus]|uniref:Glucosyl-3-phosphoglycerate synthase n=1 Tax=Caloramator fervidus TaxID=29344 RepID=A0A1H5S506_9CLOT|nr:glycosyltransferase family 2 protein [Caloramator fervidus]SEF45550.1 Glycosyltransferase involved in cell wall bisynthesis [Caloramator fervidus]
MKATCVIPAYNEEKTIGKIIDVVKNINLIEKIIVVSDGSSDNTADIAKERGAHVIELEKNLGKGAAVKVGIENSESDVILLLDADLIGLKEKHVYDLLLPIFSDEADMTIGVFVNGRFATDLAQKIAPFLSGQRGVKKDILNKIDKIDITKYGIEIALTKYAKKYNYRVRNVELPDLTHIMKEEKLGFKEGFKARLRMYKDIIRCLRI